MNQEPPTAFPWTHDNMTCTGMTLCDYFAAKAMQGILYEGLEPVKTAKHAYEMADAMMAARSATK